MRREADFSILEKFPQKWIEKAQIIAQALDESDYYREPDAYTKAGIPYGKELKNLLKPLGLAVDDFEKLVGVKCECVRREKLTSFLYDWERWEE